MPKRQKEIHCTITGHGLVSADMKTTIPEGITVKFYVKDGEILDVEKAWYMWETLQTKKKKEYSDKPKPTDPDQTIYGEAEITKLWIGLPTEAEDWIAGVYYHGGPVDKEPDLIHMHKDQEIKKLNKAKTLDLDYMLERINDKIKSTHPNTENIIVHVLTCREPAA